MSGPGHDAEELWLLFEQDAGRSLRECEQSLLALTSSPRDVEQLNQLYRGLHSLKGNARTMELGNVESFVHYAEDLVALCRDGACTLEGEILDAVFRAVDGLQEVVPEIVESRSDVDGSRIANTCELLKELVLLNDTSGSRTAATDLEFLLFDDADFDDAAPPAPAPAPPPEKAATKDTFLNIRASKVQELLALASDLGLAADHLLNDRAVVALAGQSEEIGEKSHRLRRLTRDLRLTSSGLALVPVSTLFSRLRRVSRELGRQTKKAFDLKTRGEDTEIDKSLVEQLYDPLMHVVRNAVDHGLESAEIRKRAGKAERGTITLQASNAGSEILIEVFDDGRGLDRAAILDKAVRQGRVEAGEELSDAAVWRLILEPGFSTVASVSKLSGRGVGMDVVASTITQLRGRLDIHTRPGEGTSFLLHLPLTLAFADALIVEVEDRPYAIPLESIQRVLSPRPETYVRASAASSEYVRVDGRTVPVRWLQPATQGARKELKDTTIVTVRTSGGDLAVPVDRVRGTEQITIRPLGRLLRKIDLASACGLLPGGDIAITLDCERLVDRGR